MNMISGTITSARQPLFHYPDQLLVGNAPHVGVLDLPGTRQRPPIRLFFPADTITATATATATATSTRAIKPASYFVDNRAAYVMQGLAHIALARHSTKIHRWILRPLCWALSLIFPGRFLKIPGTLHVKTESDASAVKYAPPSSLASNNIDEKRNANERSVESSDNSKEQSLVVFSHGLTGTGEENSIFCTSLAKRGHVVASIHHRDGSSSRVPMPDGTCKYYEFLPAGDDYDPRHRLEQLRSRAKEFLYTCSWLMGEESDDDYNSDGHDDMHPIVEQIQSSLKKDEIIAAGFSYGAATASLAATLEPDRFQCAILLDPWLHIDYSSRGVEFDLPPEAFGNDWPAPGSATTTINADTGGTPNNDDSNSKKKKKGLDIPSLFINSAQFRGYGKLYGATQRLADQVNSRNNNEDGTADTKRAEMHVIPGTNHQNFCDTIFWLPRRLSKRMFRLGEADAYESYAAILNCTNRFLDRF